MDAPRHSPVALVALVAVFVFRTASSAEALQTEPAPGLAVINAGVSSSEDAPFVSSSYRFLPGDNVYFTFEIAGFLIRAEQRGEVRKISLHYEIEPQDETNRPLAPSSPGDIETELSPEDKNWVPKRRVSFMIPSFVAAGSFHIHVLVKDLYGKAETARDYPFHIGGIEVKKPPAVTIQNFRFERGENDTEPLSVPAYSPGDTVYARFEITGYRLGPDNNHRVAYGVTVFGPNGKPFIKEPKAADLESKSFYPAQFVPGNVELTVGKNSAHGEYVVVVTVRDLLANQQYETKQAFSIE
ncbi:MAG: hypothetical protein M3Y24_05390 [Acidobacteriota bacterium]|nr:hypothetical protein [Acidobacteriota bacterium]